MKPSKAKAWAGTLPMCMLPVRDAGMLLLLSGQGVVNPRILTASLVVPFSLHQVKFREESELGTETKLSMASVWRGGPIKENAESI